MRAARTARSRASYDGRGKGGDGPPGKGGKGCDKGGPPPPSAAPVPTRTTTFMAMETCYAHALLGCRPESCYDADLLLLQDWWAVHA